MEILTLFNEDLKQTKLKLTVHIYAKKKQVNTRLQE